MKKLSLAFLVVLVSALALASASTTAFAARATKEPFSATLEVTEILGAERWWTDEEGTTHVRGWVFRGLISGDIVGQVEFVENVNMNASYVDVLVKGAITVGGKEAYRMSADLTLEGGVISSSNFVCNGMGSFKGIHITGTIAIIDSTHSLWTGTKLTTKP